MTPSLTFSKYLADSWNQYFCASSCILCHQCDILFPCNSASFDPRQRLPSFIGERTEFGMKIVTINSLLQSGVLPSRFRGLVPSTGIFKNAKSSSLPLGNLTFPKSFHDHVSQMLLFCCILDEILNCLIYLTRSSVIWLLHTYPHSTPATTPCHMSQAMHSYFVFG